MDLHISDAAKKAERDYKREWRRRNKDKVKASQARYWEKKALQGKEVIEGECDETCLQDGRDPAVSEH